LEEHRQPHIVLVDNIEMHLYYKRHLNAIAQIKNLFAGKQIIATTHSQVVMQSYEPKSEIIDLETLLEEQHLVRQAAEAGN
jgi:predicted ATP-binding protein involved in virulence